MLLRVFGPSNRLPVRWAPRMPCLSGLGVGLHVTHALTTRVPTRWSGVFLHVGVGKTQRVPTRWSGEDTFMSIVGSRLLQLSV
jgi:hypothetical protein